MNIGDVVYVARPMAYGIIMLEVLVTKEVRESGSKNASWMRPWGTKYFGGRILRKFSLLGGWGAESTNKSYSFKLRDTYPTLEATLPVVERSLESSRLSARASLEICQRNLQLAQEALQKVQNTLDFYSKMDAKELIKYQTYVSPFTGKVL